MNKLVIERLNARRLNGFREEDRILLGGLKDGLNVVYAPNRSGKTTLTAAFQLAIGERPEQGSSIDADGFIDSEGVKHSVECEVANGRHGGQMPKADTASRYVMHLPDLVKELPQTDREAAQQAISGYRFDIPRPPGTINRTAEEKRLEDLLRGHRSKAATIEDDRNKVHGLEREVEDRKQAAQDARWLRIAIAQLRIREVDSEWPGIELQPGDAAVQVSLKQQAVITARDRFNETRDALLLVAPTERLAGEERSESEKAALRDRAKRVQQATGQLPLLRGSLASANVHLTESAADIGDVEADWAIAPADALKRATSLAKQADAARILEAQAEALEQAKRKLHGNKPVQGANEDQVYERLRTALTNMLSTRRIPSSEAGSAKLLGGAAAFGLLAAIGFVRELHWLGAVAGLVAGLMAAWVYCTARTAGPKDLDPMSDAQKYLGADAPATAADFAEAFSRKALEVTKVSAMSELVIQLTGMIDMIDRTNVGQYETLLKTVIAETGLLNLDPYQLSDLLTRYGKWRNAKSDQAVAANEVEQAEEELESLRLLIRHEYERHGFEPREALNPEDAITDFENWFTYSSQYRIREKTLLEAAKILNDYLDQIGIPPGEPEERVAQVESRGEHVAFRDMQLSAIRQQLQELDCVAVNDARIFEAVGRRNQDAGLSVADVVTSEEHLVKAKGNAETSSMELEDVSAKLANLRAGIKTFEESGTVAEAEADLARSISAAERRVNDQLRKTSRSILRREIQDASRREAAPILMRIANDKLRTIDGHLSMRVEQKETGNEGLGPLVVDDNRLGREGQRFSQLATSAKVNAVLAARLALIEIQEGEGGIHFPLFVDEIMGVADRNTRRGIAQLLVSEAEQRQVVFFTNNELDAEVVREQVGTGAHMITIGGGDLAPGDVAVHDDHLPSYRAAPGPIHLTLDRQVMAHNPRVVLTDETDLETVGDAPTVAVALERLDPVRRAEIEPIVEALEAIRAEIKERLPILTWESIAGQPWVTGTFRENMRSDLEACLGNATRFMGQITAYHGIRSKTLDAARAFLEDKGYLGAVPPTTEELRERAMVPLVDTRNASYVAAWCVEAARHLLAAKDTIE